MSEYLTASDLKKVRNYLWDVRIKWFDIGIELNLDPDQLEVIKCDYRNVEDCYRQMLLLWLSQINPTWQELVAALKSRVINCGRIAEKIIQEENIVSLQDHETSSQSPLFKNKYNQIEAEEAIANALCAHIREPIREQIERLIGPKMVGIMKGSEHHFSSKMALKVKVLTDICEGEERHIFTRCMVYVENARKCLEEHIHVYTVKFCNEKVSGENTRLQQKAKEEVTNLIDVVENAVTTVNEVNILGWLSSFCKNNAFRCKLGVDLQPTDLLCGYDPTQPLDLENFELKVRYGLLELKKMLHTSYDKIRYEEEMVNWKVKPHELLNSLIGCTEQCPFCGEQCDMLDPRHYEENGLKHRTVVHRMSCLTRRKTQTMEADHCPVNVASSQNFYRRDNLLHPYKRYQEVYPDWSIPPDRAAESSLFWKWFVGKYHDSLAKEYNARPQKIPPQWSGIEWRTVKANLKDIYRL